MAWLRRSVLLAVLTVVTVIISSPLQAHNKDSARVAVGQPSIASKQLTRDAWQMVELFETAANRAERFPHSGARTAGS
jgi:hypothetical protein